MELIDRLHCKHCAGGGTCKSGLDGASCAVCSKRSGTPVLKRWFFTPPSGNPNYFGVVCSICDGKGTVEPATMKFHNRMAPVLALGVTFFSGWLLRSFRGDPN